MIALLNFKEEKEIKSMKLFYDYNFFFRDEILGG